MRNIFFITILIFIFGSCEKASNNELSVNQSTFEVPFDETNLVIQIYSSSAWNVDSNASWCEVNQESGIASQAISLTLTPNINPKARQAIITISDGESRAKVEIKQGVSDGKEYHYKIPIIFHILYQDKSNENQYVKKDWMAHVLAKCNDLYANALDSRDPDKKGVDVNLEFVMAATDPTGKVLEEPGVERIYTSTPRMNHNKFMNTNNAGNADNIAMLWDLNRYINIFVYEFDNQSVLGASLLPYTLQSHHLDGLCDGDFYLENNKLKYVHCVSINNIAIYRVPEPAYVVADNITETLAHELGHYIGLYHAFGVDHIDREGNAISWKDDTDYCEDTPNYDRVAYEKWLIDYDKNTPPEKQKFKEMATRTSIDGKNFISRNIMDYTWSYSNEFTPDQRQRIRHVLNYSPLMPGPKFDRSTSRANGQWTVPPSRIIE